MFQDLLSKFKSSKYAKKRYLVLFFLVVCVGGFAIFSPYGVVNRLSLESEKREILEKIAIERKISDSLRQHIKILESEDYEIEKIAREKYGMIKPGERVYLKNIPDSNNKSKK